MTEHGGFMSNSQCCYKIQPWSFSTEADLQLLKSQSIFCLDF